MSTLGKVGSDGVRRSGTVPTESGSVGTGSCSDPDVGLSHSETRDLSQLIVLLQAQLSAEIARYPGTDKQSRLLTSAAQDARLLVVELQRPEPVPARRQQLLSAIAEVTGSNPEIAATLTAIEAGLTA